MTVLVYGTGTKQQQISNLFLQLPIRKMRLFRLQIENSSFQFIFVGALVKVKNPLYAIKIVGN
jgi:hypothetical protein